jgi:glycosyltransferase involved in cell wall biosynthesis
MRLGIIARSDNTGLGNQTRELVNMLKPSKVMLIDSSPFNKNKQHPEWYKQYNCQYIRGFPRRFEIEQFLKNLDVVLSCETFYNKDFISLARMKNVKTVLQYNYEFLDHLQRPELELPDVLLSPSSWGLEAVIEAFGSKSTVLHLPPPTAPETFFKQRSNNLSKDHNRILHVGGKPAHMDRNGTNSVIEMLAYSKTDYEIVFTSQATIDISLIDSRISINKKSPENREDLYDGFDAMILPRRYAGLCLPMNEALMSGLPVFMTDISPNNKILPKDWLVKSKKINQFKARTEIDVYAADPESLAKTIDEYINNSNKISQKEKAVDIAMSNFATENLKQKYLDILQK